MVQRKFATIEQSPEDIAVCTIVGVDYNKENETSTKRPIRIVDKGAKPVEAVIA